LDAKGEQLDRFCDTLNASAATRCGMECPSCKADIPAGSKFCTECGASLPLACPACGYGNPGRAKFRANCGNKLTGVSVASAEAAEQHSQINVARVSRVPGKAAAIQAARELLLARHAHRFDDRTEIETRIYPEIEWSEPMVEESLPT
jgi:hypothetical protein